MSCTINIKCIYIYKYSAEVFVNVINTHATKKNNNTTTNLKSACVNLFRVINGSTASSFSHLFIPLSTPCYFFLFFNFFFFSLCFFFSPFSSSNPFIHIHSSNSHHVYTNLCSATRTIYSFNRQNSFSWNNF